MWGSGRVGSLERRNIYFVSFAESRRASFVMLPIEGHMLTACLFCYLSDIFIIPYERHPGLGRPYLLRCGEIALSWHSHDYKLRNPRIRTLHVVIFYYAIVRACYVCKTTCYCHFRCHLSLLHPFITFARNEQITHLVYLGMFFFYLKFSINIFWFIHFFHSYHLNTKKR